MKKIDLGQTITIVANLAVLIGILLLVLELNQTSQATQGQTRNDIANQPRSAGAVAGRGRARLGDRYEVIGPGDAILVPPGNAHQVSNPFDEDLKVVFFMATPELAKQMRAIHERETAEPDRPITQAEDEEFSRRFGGSRTISE